VLIGDAEAVSLLLADSAVPPAFPEDIVVCNFALALTSSVAAVLANAACAPLSAIRTESVVGAVAIFAGAWTPAARAPALVPEEGSATRSGANDDSSAEADALAGVRVTDSANGGEIRAVETSAPDTTLAAARPTALAGNAPESGSMPESRSNRIFAGCAPEACGAMTANSADAVALEIAVLPLGDAFAPASCPFFLAWVGALLLAAFVFLFSGLSRMPMTADSAFFAPETAKEAPAASSLAAARVTLGLDDVAEIWCRMAPMSVAGAASADVFGRENGSPGPTPAPVLEDGLAPEPNCCST